MLLTFAAPIKFNLVLKYIDSCLLYARGFFDTSLPRQKYVFAPTLFIMYSFTVMQIFMIKNTLLPIISLILCNTSIFNIDEFILQSKYATKIYHSWEDCKYWYGCLVTVIRPYTINYFNQERIITKINSKSNEYADTLRKQLDARQIGVTLTLELIRRKFTEPLSKRLNELSYAVENMQGTTSAGNILVSGQGQKITIEQFKWVPICTYSGTLTTNHALDAYLKFFWGHSNIPIIDVVTMKSRSCDFGRQKGWTNEKCAKTIFFGPTKRMVEIRKMKELCKDINACT